MRDVNNSIVFINHDGNLTQEIIANMTETLEKNIEQNNIKMGISTNIITIFIELAQNIMNYSKSIDANCTDSCPGGLILVSIDEDNNYYIQSQNVVSTEDKDKMEQKLIEIDSLDRDAIKARYRELRRSGQNTHNKGGGIGFYEIAKRCDEIKYNFMKINVSKYIYHIKIKINTQKKNK